ncbi:MAG: acyl-CoA thioesterase [Bacteroidales bacterium]|nr:acyl-CoA thioesterase [Bacteroidales bacterium]
MEEQFKNSMATQYRAVFPELLNATGTLFGGHALKWMDEAAYITATRFTRDRMFTVTIEKLKFLKAIHPDTIVEIISKVEKVEKVRLYVKVELYAEEMYGPGREKAIEGLFVFASLDEKYKPHQLKGRQKADLKH